MSSTNFAGTASDPYTPSGFIIPVGTVKRDTTGLRRATGKPFYAHDTTYGNVITATATIAAFSNFDAVYVGAVVRTGANAGAFIGVNVYTTGIVQIVRCNAAGTETDISNTLDPSGITAGDIISVSYNKTTGAITATKNGGALSFTGTTTDSTYGAEASLAAGGGFDAGNVNGSYVSLFETTGESAGSVKYLRNKIFTFGLGA